MIFVLIFRFWTGNLFPALGWLIWAAGISILIQYAWMSCPLECPCGCKVSVLVVRSAEVLDTLNRIQSFACWFSVLSVPVASASIVTSKTSFVEFRIQTCFTAEFLVAENRVAWNSCCVSVHSCWLGWLGSLKNCCTPSAGDVTSILRVSCVLESCESVAVILIV